MDIVLARRGGGTTCRPRLRFPAPHARHDNHRMLLVLVLVLLLLLLLLLLHDRKAWW